MMSHLSRKHKGVVDLDNSQVVSEFSPTTRDVERDEEMDVGVLESSTLDGHDEDSHCENKLERSAALFLISLK